MFSAYDLKKIIPRAVFALVAANLSWSLMSIAIGVVNILGEGAKDLIVAPFASTAAISPTSTGDILLLTIAAGAVASAGLGLIPVAGVAVAALGGILFAFIIILARRVALLGLVVIAPFAIALMVFPQTEKWAKQWWEWFLKLLIMYPFIMGFFGLAQVAAGITSRAGNPFYELAAFAIIVMPYFLIGKALSFAGGTIAKFAGAINDPSKGMVDKTKEWEGKKVAERRLKTGTGDRFDQDSWRGRALNRPLRGIMNAPSTLMHPSSAKRNAAAVLKQERAQAVMLKSHPELEKLSDDEAELAAMGSEQMANERIDVRVAEAEAQTPGSGAARRRELEMARETLKAKGGGFGTLVGKIALPQAVKSGRVGAHEIEDLTTRMARGSSHGTDTVRVLQDQARTTAGQGYKDTGRVLQSQLYSAKHDTGDREGLSISTEGINSVLTAPDDASRTAATAALPQNERVRLNNVVNDTFTGGHGRAAVSQEQLGKMERGERSVVIDSKQAQVASTLENVRMGTVSGADAAVEIARHRADALSLAQASAKKENQDGVTAANTLIAQIDQQITNHNTATPPGTTAVVDNTVVEAESTRALQQRFGLPGERPTDTYT
jgi:hypothetical protein